MSELKKPKRYDICIKHFKSGANCGRTKWRYSTKIKALMIAAGYQAALYDMGRTDLYVHVMENGVTLYDSDTLKEFAEREC
jgi:hypothetical protein